MYDVPTTYITYLSPVLTYCYYRWDPDHDGRHEAVYIHPSIHTYRLIEYSVVQCLL